MMVKVVVSSSTRQKLMLSYFLSWILLILLTSLVLIRTGMVTFSRYLSAANNKNSDINGVRHCNDDAIRDSDQFELAKFESLGYFDDIDEMTWNRHQQRVRQESLYYDPSSPNRFGKADPAKWLLVNVDPLFACPNIRRVGGRGDGPKWVCDPHRLVHQLDCLIYSIGSRGIYHFEDGMVSVLEANDPRRKMNAKEGRETSKYPPNCEIHVFDPSPEFARANDVERNNIHYHAIGLKSSYVPFQFGPFPTSYEFLTLPEIRQRLGHENRRIDIFKIDCEGCEWSTYQDWLHPDIDIRQILIETHSIPIKPDLFFDRFLDMGFVPFSKEANTHPGAKPHGTFFEWGFIKLHTNFLRRTTNLMNVTF